MKVLLISAYPPSPHNIGVPSAHPFYLAKNKIEKIEFIDLIYFSGHEKKEKLYKPFFKGVFKKVKKLSINYFDVFYYKFLDLLRIRHKYFGSAYRCLPNKKIIDEIKLYDLVWIYPCLLFPWAKLIDKYSDVIITTPDCSLLHYELALKFYKRKSYLRKLCKSDKQVKSLEKLYQKSLFREKIISKSNYILHVVGLDDLNRYKKINSGIKKIFFNPHPLYLFTKKKQFNNKKLSILFTGTNHSIYIGDLADRITRELIINRVKLNQIFKITFLGKNFEKNCNLLQTNGFETKIIEWVDSYENEIINHDVHIFTTILGTGTKGKVLCSLASSLICIGNNYSFENISVENENLLYYEEVTDIIDYLFKINLNKSLFFNKAKSNSEKVIKSHNEEITSKLFWERTLKNLE